MKDNAQDSEEATIIMLQNLLMPNPHGGHDPSAITYCTVDQGVLQSGYFLSPSAVPVSISSAGTQVAFAGGNGIDALAPQVLIAFEENGKSYRSHTLSAGPRSKSLGYYNEIVGNFKDNFVDVSGTVLLDLAYPYTSCDMACSVSADETEVIKLSSDPITDGGYRYVTVSDDDDIDNSSLYAMGVLSALQGSLAPENTFGHFYILAPENACSGYLGNMLDFDLFQNVWQYGTEEWQDANGNPFDYASYSATYQPANSEYYNNPWQQDGIAPQCAVPELYFDQVAGTSFNEDNQIQYQARRIQFAGESKHLNFRDAHSVSSYGWIFKIKSGDDGVVVKRN